MTRGANEVVVEEEDIFMQNFFPHCEVSALGVIVVVVVFRLGDSAVASGSRIEGEGDGEGVVVVLLLLVVEASSRFLGSVSWRFFHSSISLKPWVSKVSRLEGAEVAAPRIAASAGREEMESGSMFVMLWRVCLVCVLR